MRYFLSSIKWVHYLRKMVSLKGIDDLELTKSPENRRGRCNECDLYVTRIDT